MHPPEIEGGKTKRWESTTSVAYKINSLVHDMYCRRGSERRKARQKYNSKGIMNILWHLKAGCVTLTGSMIRQWSGSGRKRPHSFGYKVVFLSGILGLLTCSVPVRGHSFWILSLAAVEERGHKAPHAPIVYLCVPLSVSRRISLQHICLGIHSFCNIEKALRCQNRPPPAEPVPRNRCAPKTGPLEARCLCS